MGAQKNAIKRLILDFQFQNPATILGQDKEGARAKIQTLISLKDNIITAKSAEIERLRRKCQ